MARIELHKVFRALDKAECRSYSARKHLQLVSDSTLDGGNYDSKRMVDARVEIDNAIAELQKAKQILTKE